MSNPPTANGNPPLVKGMNRRSQILRLLMRYRHSGVFSGMNLDAAGSQAEVPADGNPEQFVSDLEALGPTFVKLGQMLSTRPDMVPVEFATALERMQEKVAEVMEAVQKLLGESERSRRASSQSELAAVEERAVQ